MSKHDIPRYVTEKYKNGARGFKSQKRQQLRQLKKALNDLRIGCAFFPCAMDPVDAIAERVQYLERELSIKNWGR